MIYNIFKTEFKDSTVITNSSGANLYGGIVTTFIKNFTFKKTHGPKYAIIEVDEANVRFITEHIKPKNIAVTNLFRDQLDRYGELYTTLNKILEGVEKTPESTLLLNGDESLLGKLDVTNKVVYFGFSNYDNSTSDVNINADAKFCKYCKAAYKYNFVTYNHLGDYYCPECSYKRPELQYKITDILEVTATESTVLIGDDQITINQPGTYNIYNGLCAYAMGKIFNISMDSIKNALGHQQSSFGRQETICINDKEIKIILVKNPAGYDEAINTVCLHKDRINLCFMLNDNYADGRDISWIWDVCFEKLPQLDVDSIFISGVRKYDMAVRLKTAGFDRSKFIICDDYKNVLDAIDSVSTKTTYILATYTAMTDFRKYLSNKGYAKKIW
ncbi:UDP-N-acetylmuramyl tripeptide synthase [Hathewaya proteolytica DSM 3090]|uniref:UDP-N-acetylmuramyl tripeptide synthase n=2 Tax=Hathewaya proteolytica TaxID=29365 RepID=A0A1M6KNA9_9CLOT|nr:UDP-N-acetylmuramyl tripeptide synthase [Hathewaya proteolytica DSM 3090]